MMPESLAVGIFWLSLTGSLVFSVLAAVDSWREYFAVRYGHEQAKILFVNGRVKIARFRRANGFWYVIGFNAMAAVFVLVAYRAFVEPPEVSDRLMAAAATRLLALLVVVAFWRTMRGQRRIRKELEDATDIKQDVQRVHEMQQKTYEKVESIDERLDGEDASG